LGSSKDALFVRKGREEGWLPRKKKGRGYPSLQFQEVRQLTYKKQKGGSVWERGGFPSENTVGMKSRLYIESPKPISLECLLSFSLAGEGGGGIKGKAAVHGGHIRARAMRVGEKIS